MAHVREVARKTGKAYEVQWRDAGRDRQRTFARRREADRFAPGVDVAVQDGATIGDRARPDSYVNTVSIRTAVPRLCAPQTT